MTIGAVLWPDEPAQKTLNVVRQEIDPHFLLIEPHITIIFPAEMADPVPSLVKRLEKSIAGLSPFRVLLGRLSTINEEARRYPEATARLLDYPNAKNAIFLIPEEGYSEILDLKRRINRAIDQVTPLVEYPPYLTLGQTLSETDYTRALAKLSGYDPKLRFAAASFDLLQQTADGHWQTIHRFPLTG